ncbi:type II toxin-antitoxin system prevent-host-death family antitoxin [Sandarakinorhabdus sp.]|uniref:type II toxin-antitoxin system Phd/YefM family antitoxin n=1 Tax=Sandarakinorhabdus sp. TaxID=1916663 RepID=UPI0033424019
MDINIAQAKPRLSELVERAESGETVRISRRGKPVVELRVIAPSDAPQPFDWNALTVLVSEQKMWTPPPGYEDMSFVEYLRRTDQL